jgi:hypothetical protein
MFHMNGLRERLTACFVVVFPDLTAEGAIVASPETIAAWDSSNHLLLMRVIEEEFAIQIPMEVLAEIDSFSGFEDYLAGKSSPS